MIRRIAIISLALFGLILGAAWMTPDRWRAEASADIAAPPEVIWIWVSTPSRWSEWMSGEVGELQLVDGEAHRQIRLAREPDRRFPVTGLIELVPLDSGLVRVVWKEEAGLGWDPVLRLLRPMVEDEMRTEFGLGLGTLKELAEAEAMRSPPIPDPHFRLPTVRLLQDDALPEATPAQ